MDLESIFVDSKWKILTELAKGQMSPTELAAATGTSMPNISAQLRLLEALDFIERIAPENIERGEARKYYRLNKCFAYVILGSKVSVGKKFISLDPASMLFFNVWLLPDHGTSQTLLKYIFDNYDKILECHSFGLLTSKGTDIELLAIHDNPQGLGLSNNVQWRGKSYSVNAHLHTLESFREGIARKDSYFESVMAKVVMLYDKAGLVQYKRRSK